MRLNTKSLIFRSGIIFLLMTVMNISLFILMIFENQIDLIIENSLLRSQITAGDFLGGLNEILGTERTWTPAKEQKTLLDGIKLGWRDFTIFGEDGTVLFHVKDGQKAPRDSASIDELRQINSAITRRAFENKTFTQKVLEGSTHLELYLPFTLSQGRQGAVALHSEMTDIKEKMALLYRQSFVVGLIVFFIAAVFAFFVFRQIFIPLRALRRGARLISAGNLETRVPIVRQDEIGELATAFNEMSVAIRNMHDEARGANPLSGLPGNITIAKVIDARIEDHSTFAVLYSDLDNFKAYNDKYGFTRGDDAILFVRDCLLKVRDSFPEPKKIFVGHEGGDDFVVVLPYDLWRSYLDQFISIFDAGVPNFYNKTDQTNGYIESVNRQGQPMRFPLMSISIAVVSNRYRKYAHHAELVQAAAEVKKAAKKKDGSSYVEDTRAKAEE